MNRRREAPDTLPEPHKPVKHRNLSDDTQTRITMLVENSAPNPHRPRLSPARETRLADVERQTAACYASMEDITYKLRKIVEDIRANPQLSNLEPADDEKERPV